MKTTLDLPDELVKKVKLRVLKDGRKLKDAVADLLRKGLTIEMDSQPGSDRPVITTDPKTGLPVIACPRTPTSTEELTPERVAEILLAQEVEWFHDAGG